MEQSLGGNSENNHSLIRIHHMKFKVYNCFLKYEGRNFNFRTGPLKFRPWRKWGCVIIKGKRGKMVKNLLPQQNKMAMGRTKKKHLFLESGYIKKTDGVRFLQLKVPLGHARDFSQHIHRAFLSFDHSVLHPVKKKYS